MADPIQPTARALAQAHQRRVLLEHDVRVLRLVVEDLACARGLLFADDLQQQAKGALQRLVSEARHG